MTCQLWWHSHGHLSACFVQEVMGELDGTHFYVPVSAISVAIRSLTSSPSFCQFVIWGLSRVWSIFLAHWHCWRHCWKQTITCVGNLICPSLGREEILVRGAWGLEDLLFHGTDTMSCCRYGPVAFILKTENMSRLVSRRSLCTLFLYGILVLIISQRPLSVCLPPNSSSH